APVDVGEEWKRKAVLVGEPEVPFGGIERDAHDSRSFGFELGGSVTEPLALGRSTRGERLWIPPEHDPRASEIGQGDRVAGLVGKRELRRRRSLGEHEGEGTPATRLGSMPARDQEGWGGCGRSTGQGSDRSWHTNGPGSRPSIRNPSPGGNARRRRSSRAS